jgi:hypothetical protein
MFQTASISRRPARRTAWMATALLVAWAFGGATTVLAQEPSDPPGNNGTIKIHAGSTHEEPPPTDMNTEPQLCGPFHVHGFGFDTDSTGYTRIQRIEPSGSGVVATPEWAADAAGEWQTGLIELDPGHYSAAAKQTDPETPGGEKTKNFWVGCEERVAGVEGENSGQPSGSELGAGGASGDELPPSDMEDPARRDDNALPLLVVLFAIAAVGLVLRPAWGRPPS